MKNFKTKLKPNYMVCEGNEGLFDWFKGLFGNAIDKMKQAYNKVFSKKPSVTVDVEKIEAEYRSSREAFGFNNTIIQGLAGLVMMILPIGILAYWKASKNNKSSGSGDNVFTQIKQKLETNGTSNSTLPDDEIRNIAYKYSGYAALINDVKPDMLDNYFENLSEFKNDYIALPTVYDIEDLYVLTKKGNNDDSWRFSHAVTELSKRFNEAGRMYIDKNLLADVCAGVSYIYGGMISNINSNTAFTRISKILDKPLVSADLYVAIGLYEEFVYYWIKIESDTKFTYGLASSPYKQNNQYVDIIYNQIKNFTLERLEKAMRFGSIGYWEWYCTLYENGANEGYLFKFLNSYNVNPKEWYGADIFRTRAVNILKVNGIFNDPNFNQISNVIIKNILCDFAGNYYVDTIKRKLYASSCIFEDSVKILLSN